MVWSFSADTGGRYGGTAVPSTDPLAPKPPHYERRDWLDTLKTTNGAGWPGPTAASGTDMERDIETQRARSGPQGVVIPAFLPYFDTRSGTGETQQMRWEYRRMLANSVIRPAFFSQIFSVAALTCQIQPPAAKGVERQEKKRNHRIADFCNWQFQERVAGQMTGLIYNILTGGMCDGYSVLEPVLEPQESGDFAGKIVIDRVNPLQVDDDLVLQLDDKRNVVSLLGLRYNGGEIFDPARFTIYSHMPMYGMPTGTSHLRCVYPEYWMWDTGYKLRMSGVDGRAFPAVWATYQSGDREAKASLDKALARLRAQHFTSVPDTVVLQALNLAGESSAIFKDLRRDLMEQIILGITFATLQMITGGENQQRGSSDVHQDTATLGPWFIARAVEALFNDYKTGLIKNVVDMNYAVGRYPRLTLSSVNLEKVKAEIDLIEKTNKMGLPMRKSAIYELVGQEPPDPEDPTDILEGASQQGPQGMPAAIAPAVPPREANKPASQFSEGDWDEAEHPRDHGKFAKAAGEIAAKHPLPAHAEREDPPTVPSDLLQRLGRYAITPYSMPTAEERKKDPEAAAQIDELFAGYESRRSERAAQSHRWRFASLIEDMLAKKPPKPIAVSSDPRTAVSRTKKAIERYHQDEATVQGFEIFDKYIKQVAASHPDGEKVTEVAIEEAKRRRDESYKVASEHITALPTETREKATKSLNKNSSENKYSESAEPSRFTAQEFSESPTAADMAIPAPKLLEDIEEKLRGNPDGPRRQNLVTARGVLLRLMDAEARLTQYAERFAEWDEDKHPRADDGEFGKGGGNTESGNQVKPTSPASASAYKISGQPSEEHRAMANQFADKAVGLAPEKKTEYVEHLAHSLAVLPAGIAKAANAAITHKQGGVEFHNDLTALRKKAQELGGKAAAGVQGFVNDRGMGTEVHLDGGDDPRGTYVHELWHAADNNSIHSDDKGWQAAYKKDILKGKNLLSRYALTNASEGFAEFGRALAEKGTAHMESKFPNAVKHLKAKGLI